MRNRPVPKIGYQSDGKHKFADIALSCIIMDMPTQQMSLQSRIVKRTYTTLSDEAKELP